MWLPSATFVLVALIFVGSGVALFRDIAHPVLPFVFILSGWIVSVCLHEFGHAITAYIGGDKSVASSGYLTLDPLKYAHPLMSIVLPVAFIAFGGYAFPGGAMIFNPHALRSRMWESLVLAAGPATNALVAVVFGLGFMTWMNAPSGTGPFYDSLAFLCFLQVMAVILNLLPLPGLDGFGIVRPWLPRSVRQATNVMAAGVAWILLLLIVAVPGFGAQIFDWGMDGARWLGVPRAAVDNGLDRFQFWSADGGWTMSPVAAGGLVVISMAMMKLGTMNQPGVDRRKALIWGVVVAAMMVAAAVGYQWVEGR